MILKLALSGLLGTTVLLFANNEVWAGTTAMAVLAGVIVFMSRSQAEVAKETRKLTVESTRAMTKSAKASENLAAILADRPCYLDGEKRNEFIEALAEHLRKK